MNNSFVYSRFGHNQGLQSQISKENTIESEPSEFTKVLPSSSEIDTNLNIFPEDNSVLKGHSNEITCIAWNPKEDILATGSKDSTVILWSIRDDIEKKVLDHSRQGKTGQLNDPVTALDWNPDGSLLATGTKIGFVRIWGANGNLKFKRKGGSTMLKDIRWNKSGTLIGGAFYDGQIVIWSTEAGKLKKIQQFKVSGTSSETVDWQTDNTFLVIVYKDIQVYTV
jgi:transducin (beta)-like 1